MIEILFFAILSGYLFFRLWSVLGDRSGFERPKQPDEEKREDVLKNVTVRDNVVVLPNRNVLSFEQKKEEIGEPFWEELRKIQEKEKDFKIEEFLENAIYAFKMITQAFVEGDRETLKSLLMETTYGQFCEVIDRRLIQGHRVSNDIMGNVDVDIESIKVLRKQAHITLKFTSNQRFVTYDAAGAILDNPEEISTKMVNYWTFTRTLGDTDPTWQLSQTRVDA